MVNQIACRLVVCVLQPEFEYVLKKKFCRVEFTGMVAKLKPVNLGQVWLTLELWVSWQCDGDHTHLGYMCYPLLLWRQ